MFFQYFLDLYGVFVIRYYEGEYSPLLFGWEFPKRASVCESC